MGIDRGKRTYTTIAMVGKSRKVTIGNGKTAVAGWQALYRKLDRVAIEAGGQTFAVIGCRVFVLNPHQLAVIYRLMQKTDKEDSLKLAHMLEDIREKRLPAVPVPNDREMKWRKLVAAYRREQGNRNRVLNRLHTLFVSRGIMTVVKKDLAKAAGRGKR